MRRFSERVLPVPPFYARGNPQGAVTWFKDTAAVRELLTDFGFYFRILKAYGLELCEARTQHPGKIFYEDEYQVAVCRR